MAREKVFGIFGLGMFGRELCSSITQNGGKVIAFDTNRELVDKIKDEVYQTYIVDSTDEDAMSSLPLDSIDAAIIAIGDDIESSILTAAILKQNNVPYIVARSVNDTHSRVLKSLGVDKTVNIEIEEGRSLAQRLMSPDILDIISISAEFSVIELYAPRIFIGKSLVDLNLINDYHINIIAIKRLTHTIDELGNPVKNENIILPSGQESLKNEDILIVVGKNENIDKLLDL